MKDGSFGSSGLVWFADDGGVHGLLGLVDEAYGGGADSAAGELQQLRLGVDGKAGGYTGDAGIRGDDYHLPTEGLALPLAPAAGVEELACAAGH